MLVRSPIGDLPFTLLAVRREGRRMIVDGALGAWPSRIEIAPHDLPMLARPLLRPALLGAGLAVVAVAGSRRARCRRGTRP